MTIEVRHLEKRFGSFTALDRVSLEVPAGELVALLGPSGSGKTTLLRIIGGLESADAGSVLFHGEDAGDRPVQERQVGFVFQHYALFRHMTVFENVAFGLRVRPRQIRPSNRAITARVTELLKLVQLDWLGDRYPAQLSGGQRQRIALARALAVEPRVLLLDEPFGALDAKVRKELRRWLRRLHEEMHVTTIFVTHDQEEAMEVADRVVVMNEGRIEQVGSPDEVYESPASPFVYGFLGNVNLFHGRVADGRLQVGDVELSVPDLEGQPESAIAFVRPHEFDLDAAGHQDWSIPAVVERVRYVGPTARVELRRESDGLPFEAELPRQRAGHLALDKGSRVRLSARRYRVFPGRSGGQPGRSGDSGITPT
ncbi:MAG: sulfate ABC transporter ATP-binding protein [Gemmatimonadales bacterium]|nr:sulfate ABC transporter ATP-binding protein [Gemmatimonadales bacterium]